jgi:hypothetical protein
MERGEVHTQLWWRKLFEQSYLRPRMRWENTVIRTLGIKFVRIGGKEGDIGKACSTHGGEEECTENFGGKARNK